MADPHIVDKFTNLDAIDPPAIPTATLAVLWYIDQQGEQAFAWKFDGDVPRSTTIGDLTCIIHEVVTDDD